MAGASRWRTGLSPRKRRRSSSRPGGAERPSSALRRLDEAGDELDEELSVRRDAEDRVEPLQLDGKAGTRSRRARVRSGPGAERLCPRPDGVVVALAPGRVPVEGARGEDELLPEEVHRQVGDLAAPVLPEERLLRERDDALRVDAADAEGLDHRGPEAAVVGRDELGVGGHQGAEEVAERDVDRRQVVEGADRTSSGRSGPSSRPPSRSGRRGRGGGPLRGGRPSRRSRSGSGPGSATGTSRRRRRRRRRRGSSRARGARGPSRTAGASAARACAVSLPPRRPSSARRRSPSGAPAPTPWRSRTAGPASRASSADWRSGVRLLDRAGQDLGEGEVLEDGDDVGEPLVEGEHVAVRGSR